MRVRTVSRNMAVVGALVVTAVMGGGCERDHASVTGPANPRPSLLVKGVSQNYIWQLSWTGSPGCGFTWNWELADGSIVDGGLAGCAPASPLSGTGTIPATTTGIIVSASILESPTGCGADRTVTKPVNTSQNVSVSISLSIPKKTSVLGLTVDCPPANANFTLSN